MAAAPVATVPIEVTTHIFVKANVNKRPLSLLIDSASDTFLDKNIAQALGLAPYEVAVGGGHLTTFALADFSTLTAALGRRVDGILGRQLFARYVVDLDYANGVLRLWEPKTFQYDGPANPIPLKVGSSFAMVPGQVILGGRSANGMFILDTGANNAVTLYTPFVRRHRMSPRQRPVTITGVTFAGEGSAAVMRADGLRVGKHFLRGPITGLIDRRLIRRLPDAQFAGLIGNDLFRRFRTIVDYHGKQLILEPVQDLSAEFPFDRTGLQLRAAGDALERVIVTHVAPMSPATGRFQAGDHIVAIDDEPVSDLYVAKRKFEAPGTRKITIRRGEATSVITLATKSLL